MLLVRWRSLPALVLLALASGCSDSNGPPTSPTPPPPATPAPPPPPPDTWSIEGRVVGTLTGTPVVNARVETDVAQAVTTDAQGRFRLSGTSNPGVSPFRVTVTARGHLKRESWLMWRRGERRDVTIDLVAQQPPFSLKIFRELVRNGFEEPGKLEPIRRWTMSPSFYIRTVLVTPKDAVTPVDSRNITNITNTVKQAVRMFTGGKLRVAAIETGKTARPERHGWINIEVVSFGVLDENVCAEATVGSNPGRIRFRTFCGCGGEPVAIGIIGHEVGHALGFWHVSDPESMMHQRVENPCYQFVLTEQERRGAAVAYARPPGNADPDRDPSDAASVMPRLVIAEGMGAR